MKRCTHCKAIKPLVDFHIHKYGKSGRSPWCKVCCLAHRAKQMQNPDYKASRNAEIREYHRNNPTSRLRNKMRELVRRVIRHKDRPAEQILGYSVEELQRHLEERFQPGMSWENRRAWHIDHIKSVSAFAAEGITNPKIINSLQNLQPLWAVDNLAKGAR